MTTSIQSEFRLRNAVFCAALAYLIAGVIGCSKPVASANITGTWTQQTGISENDAIQWRFDQQGAFSTTVTLFGKTQDVVTGNYKIRSPKSEYASISGQIVECSSSKWESPRLLRVPPHSSTVLIAVNCDDDSLSVGRPECWVRKEGAAPVVLEASPETNTYAGTISGIKRNKSSFSLLLDTRVHGKQLECAVIEDEAASKLGDPSKLEGRRIEITGKPEEHWRCVILFVEDANQLKVLK